LIFKVEKENRMWPTIIIGAVALVFSAWAAHVGLSARSSTAQRKFAWKLLRLAWPSAAAAAGLTAGLVKLHEAGLPDWAGLPPP
jgi:hypothetical protein